jgi:glycine dehydrogenase subunit 1
VSFTPHTPDEVRAMLASIGVPDLEELFDDVPSRLRTRAELKLPAPLGERALFELMERRAAQNRGTGSTRSFLGAGAYAHFIPSAVDALAARGEFATAYTPYQAEISQGTLQAIFEFQTLICQLTGLDVANASLYDGASATAEAALMALRVVRRRRLLVSEGLHPHYFEVLRTYTGELDVSIERIPLGPDGRTLGGELPADTAAVILQSPSFYGPVEDVGAWADRAHAAGALLIAVTAEALSLALLRSPGAAGADLACGEAQSFGIPLSFGGPYAGFLAARQRLLRQLPGRLIGETVDAEGRRAFVMTLTTREQHIRRERATSNICTNQGLCALRVAIYLALLGRAGLRELALQNLALAHYARTRLAGAGLRLPYPAPVFNEFVAEVPGLRARFASALEGGLLAGLELGRLDPAREDELLVCTTELLRRADVDRLARELRA